VIRRRKLRVLVGVLSVGEPSLPRALQSVREQSAVATEILEFRDLPERQAHRELFAALSERGAAFDMLVKVDADMEILHPRLFVAVGKLFAAFPRVDFVPLAVDDWFTRTQIGSLNFWRGGVQWTGTTPELFTDRGSNSVRKELPLLSIDEPLVHHAYQPTTAQAVRYGAHRALKARVANNLRRVDELARAVDAWGDEPTPERAMAVFAISTALRDAAAGEQLLRQPDVATGSIVDSSSAGLDIHIPDASIVRQQIAELRDDIQRHSKTSGASLERRSRSLPGVWRTFPLLRGARRALTAVRGKRDPNELLRRGLQ